MAFGCFSLNQAIAAWDEICHPCNLQPESFLGNFIIKKYILMSSK